MRFGRKKSSDSTNAAANPAQQGRVKQIWSIYQMTRKSDPAVDWWMLTTFAITLTVIALLMLLMDLHWWVILAGIPLALMLALIVMARRAERAAYAQIAGQAGASSAALRGLRRGWNVTQEPVAVDPKTQDLIFRAVGRPGVILIAEGPLNRVRRLAAQERKKVGRLVGTNVPVTIVYAGDGEGQIPLAKLSRHITKLRPVLTKTQVSEISKRLTALGGIQMPVPQGIDPSRMRPDRKAMRGR